MNRIIGGEHVLNLDRMLASVWVKGDPVTQGSFNPIISKSTGRAVIFQTSKLKAWRDTVAQEAAISVRKIGVQTGPVMIWLQFMIQATQIEMRRGEITLESAAKKPDADKLERAVLDALSGVYYKDDAQVIDLVAQKRRSEVPGVHIAMYTVLY